MKYLSFILLFASNLFAQSLLLESDAVFPRRFVAAHGKHAIVEGYSSQGLEGWAYPYQLFRNYRIELRREGDATAVDSLVVLRRIEVTPSDVTRIYAGPDYLLRERLFVPLDRPAILISYELDSATPLDVVVHLVPSMDLMWPASTGGQIAEWSSELGGFYLTENERARALIYSPQMTAHDAQWNSTLDPFERALGFTLHVTAAAPATLAIVAAPEQSPTSAPFAIVKAPLLQAAHSLIAEAPSLRATSAEHYRALLANSLQIETPEPALNEAIQWATIALDQSWICNSDLGCALVAGYGPSRRARRPQYQWFFAGDGLIGTEALLNIGDRPRAQRELEFILKYQDSKNGMIWHELTQSARHLDWTGKFPYMFVHVDLSFQFLNEFAFYLRRTGNTNFVREHWSQIAAAYKYCESTIDQTTHLPGIPESKSGGNEQEKLRDELALSSAWIDAARSYAMLARAAGQERAAARAEQAASEAAKAILPRYWDPSRNFFVSSHTRDGRANSERSLSACDATVLSLLSPAQRDGVLDQIATTDFQTDWGSRSLAPGDNFIPAKYGNGSVWPLTTSQVAATLWRNGRPWSAEAIWRSLLPGQSIDSLGHFPEVFSGSYYREQEESVPEQTWSQAAFLSVVTESLLGLDPEPATRTFHFAPNLPTRWEWLRIQKLDLGDNKLSLNLHRRANTLELDINNSGAPFTMDFRPLLPLGAQNLRAFLNGKSINVQVLQQASETRAKISARLPNGESHLVLQYEGGISLIVPPAQLSVGEPTHAFKLISATLEGRRVSFRVALPPSRATQLLLRSSRRPLAPLGAQLEPGGSSSEWRLVFDPPQTGSTNPTEFRVIEASVELSPY